MKNIFSNKEKLSWTPRLTKLLKFSQPPFPNIQVIFSRFFSCLILLCCLGSCSKDDTSISENYFIADELQPYLDMFVTAGETRGHSIDLEAAKIEAYLAIINEGGVVGQCQFDSNSPHTINIDRRYWRQASELEKEYLILHELGHCYLERGHRDEKQSDGTCFSIMESGLGNCRSNFTSTTKEAYLDELFE